MSAFHKFAGMLSAFAGNRRGNIAVIYGLALLPLAIAAGAALDYARAVVVRYSLADALDAAGLAVGGSPAMDQAAMEALAQSYFSANYAVNSAYGTPTPVHLVQTGQDFALSSSVTVPTVLLHLAGIDTLPVAYSVTITRNSKNLEVALALDITGSMSGQRIADLKVAAKDLIDLVVQDAQSPTYSKVAIAPYSQAVNVGSYADQVRGPIAAGKAITGASKTNPIVITAANHGFSNGDIVAIDSVAGMTQLNYPGHKVWKVGNVNTNSFSLYWMDDPDHTNGSNVNGTYGFSSYSSGGYVYCTNPGCKYYRFADANGGYSTFPVSTCVTERTLNAYSDTAPSSTPLGRNYPASSNPCVAATIVPLSSDRTVLKGVVDGFTASGSTAGHIGTAWAWYLLAPNFSYLWPSASQPAAYNAENTMKFAVIMTDGAYNTPYCNGVISKDAGSGSGSTGDHNNCNAPNGSSVYQAKQLCSAMKANNIVVYTVGFAVGNDATARDVLTSCASDSAHAYFAETGGDLKTVFRDIAQQITNLRLKS